MTKSPINTDLAPAPVGPYPHARQVGELLILSGVGPRQPGAKAIPGVTINEKNEIQSYDITAQTHAVFKNVKIILEAAGATWENLVDVTVFLTNMKDDFQTMNTLYKDYFPDPETQPCRTTVEVNALPTPIAIELKCIAHFPKGALS